MAPAQDQRQSGRLHSCSFSARHELQVSPDFSHSSTSISSISSGSGVDFESETAASHHVPTLTGGDVVPEVGPPSGVVSRASTLVRSQIPSNLKQEADLEKSVEDEKPEFFPLTSDATGHSSVSIKSLSDPTINRFTRFGTWFSPYRKLFIFVLLVNLVGIFLSISNIWLWAQQNLSFLVILNVMIAIAIRNEWILRFLYWISIKLFRWSWYPAWFRAQVVGILYHIGGIHSGCGMSSLFWLIHSLIDHYLHFRSYHLIILINLSCIGCCILFTCLFAFPFIRGSHHNFFELSHRFVGWLGLLLTFTFIIVSSGWDSNRKNWNFELKRLIHKPELWFMVFVFVMVISSWVTTAQVPVEIFTSSNKASVVKFPGGLTSGLHTRISFGGLKEWHIFGSVSEGKKSDCHYIVAAVQGEFTRELNLDKPQMIYTKRWKPCGLPYFSRLFHRGIAICTGSGIGAVGSTCIQHEDWYLIWIGSNLEETYGTEIMSLIVEKIPSNRRLIWDTKKPELGRPDVVKLLRKTFNHWSAEVALFIGSPALNKTVLETSKKLGLPVFGSIWDA